MSAETPSGSTKPSSKPLKEWQGPGAAGPSGASVRVDGGTGGTYPDPKSTGDTSSGPSEGSRRSGVKLSRESRAALAKEREKKRRKLRLAEIKRGFRENLAFIVFGAALLVLSIFVWGTPILIASRYYHLSTMFLIVGAVSVAGGTLTSLLPEDDDLAELPRSTESHVVLRRSEWAASMEELNNLRTLVGKILPKDLIDAAMKPTMAAQAGPITLDRLKEAMDMQGAKMAALNIAVSGLANIPGPEKPTVEVAQPASQPVTPAAQEAVPKPMPQMVTPAKPPVVPRAEEEQVSPLPTLTEAAGTPTQKFLGLGTGALDWEVAAFRTARTTGVMRKTNEAARNYVMRSALEAALEATKVGGAAPSMKTVVKAITNNLIEAQRDLTSRQVNELSNVLERDAKKWVEDTGIPRNPGENLLDFATRVSGALEVAETRVSVELPKPKPMAGLQWTLALFRGFFVSYLGDDRADELIKQVGMEATEGGPAFTKRIAQGDKDDLSILTGMVKDTIRSWPLTTISTSEKDTLVNDFEEFIKDMKGGPGSAPSETAPPLRPVSESPAGERPLERAPPPPAEIPTPAPPSPAPAIPPQPAPQRPQEVPARPLVSSPPLRAPPRPTPPGAPPPPPPGGQMNSVDWEVLTFRAASSSGLVRDQNEPAKDYLKRAYHEIARLGKKPAPLAMATAVSGTLMEAHRSLTERQMRQLSQTLDEPTNQWSQEIKVPRNPGEHVLDYAARARSVLEALVRTSSEAIPQRELAGLRWSLTLFKGFLEGYLGKKETEAIIEEVQEEVESGQVAEGEGGAKAKDELVTYAQLVKNALRTLMAKGYEKERIEQLLREFDQFVEDMSAPSPAVPGLTKTRRTTEKEAPERIKKMFGWVPEKKEEE